MADQSCALQSTVQGHAVLPLLLALSQVCSYLLEEQENVHASGGPLPHPAVALSACIALVP